MSEARNIDLNSLYSVLLREIENDRVQEMDPSFYRSLSEYLGKLKEDGKLAASGVPVIQVAMIGTDTMQPPGRTLPKVMRPGIRIGKPLDFSRYEGMENDRYILRSITDEIMYEIMRLSGQEYVDQYATRAKEEQATSGLSEPRAPRLPGMR